MTFRYHTEGSPSSKWRGKCIPLFYNNFYISVGCAHNVAASRELATDGQTTSIEGIETIGEGGNDVAVYHFNHRVDLSGESRDGSRGLGGDICFFVGSNFKSILATSVCSVIASAPIIYLVLEVRLVKLCCAIVDDEATVDLALLELPTCRGLIGYSFECSVIGRVWLDIGEVGAVDDVERTISTALKLPL